MSLRSRLSHLERKAGRHEPRYIVVSTDLDTREPAGSIARFPNGRGYTLRVPHAFGSDPLAGLTGEQRAFLEPDDEVTVLVWSEWPPGSPSPERLEVGEIVLRWTE